MAFSRSLICIPAGSAIRRWPFSFIAGPKSIGISVSFSCKEKDVITLGDVIAFYLYKLNAYTRLVEDLHTFASLLVALGSRSNVFSLLRGVGLSL